MGQRLSAISTRRLGSKSLETELNERKARISGPVRRRLQTVANRRTAWLAAQCRSNQSPREFPVIREFNRVFRNFGHLGSDRVSENPCAAAIFPTIPYSD